MSVIGQTRVKLSTRVSYWCKMERSRDHVKIFNNAIPEGIVNLYFFYVYQRQRTFRTFVLLSILYLSTETYFWSFTGVGNYGSNDL